MKSTSAIYLPGLNGLRALAALSVLWAHTFQDTFGRWGIKVLHLPFFADGVTLFFVISGFLITFLLLNEWDKTHTIDIPKFYMRRILRIWPIYYGYLLVSLLVLWIVGQKADMLNQQLWYYLFFAANIPFLSAVRIWPIVHYWSIGVEEQFYLFWPWLVRIGKKNLLPLALIVFFVCLGFKWGGYVFLGKESFLYNFFSVTRFHCMMVGAIGAILYYQRNTLYMKLLTNKMVTIIAWLLFLFSGLYADLIPSPMRAEFVALISIILIMSQVQGKPFLINVEYKWFDFIGKISYGIYVIHPLLIYLLSILYRQLHVDLPLTLQYILIYANVTFLTILIAWLSYTYFEKPFLKLKDRFAVVKSRNTFQI